jgi:hypothetical protein
MEDFLSDEVVALADVLAELRIRVRARDRECAAGCDRTQTPPPLLCKTCPNRIPPDRWQQAIDEQVMAMLRAGDREGATERIATAIGLHQPLLART